MGARRPFFVRSVFWAVPGFTLAPRNNFAEGAMDVYTKERQLEQELADVADVIRHLKSDAPEGTTTV